MADPNIPLTAPFMEEFSKAPLDGKPKPDENEIVTALESYRMEADNARRSGPNPRDQKWEDNLNLYWGRNDFSKKASWQAKETMPEVPNFVDRFAAALKEALVSSPEGFYTIHDPVDQDGDITGAIKRMTDVWLSRCGRNQMGSLLSFPAVFEEQMKMGAIMASSAVVTWKGDTENGRVAVETVDPRFVWLDHTYRNLYRVRRVELDLHDLKGMLMQKTGKGKPVFKLPEMEQLVSSITEEDKTKKEEVSGHGNDITSARKPVVLDEYIATVLDSQGEVLANRALMVVANGRFLIRGPEKNPFWHNKDWMVYTPLVTAPLSVYGRSYMEDFGSVSKTFTELTNLILDAVYTSSIKAWAIVPGMLMNPEQAAEGIHPNKMFFLEEGFLPADFAKALDMGNLPAEAVAVWNSMKSELTEAASINEIGLGQFAPKGRTSATEIVETQQSSSALIRSIAQTVETRFLDQTLDLIWKTGLQHASPSDKLLSAAAGPELYTSLMSRRRELIRRPVTFQARGISALIQKSQMLASILQLLQIIASNENLLAAFMNEVDMQKLVKLLFDLSNVDITRLQTSEREKLIRSVTGPLAGAGEGGNATEEGTRQVREVAQAAGIANGG